VLSDLSLFNITLKPIFWG
jgi:hypothetical protein